MENRKKNGLIRLLGKIGRKVKILRVPLTVLVVVCVSIHHLFRQLFFDVKYHTVRMRALMGAVCVALLLTLFVIPAVADEMFLLTTEYEEITSEEEATPTPTPTPEIVEEVPSDDSTPTDVAEAPTTDEQTDDTAIADDEAQGEGTEAQGDGTTVKDDEGITYEVDENGNIIGGDDVKKLKKTGIAAKNVGDDTYPTIDVNDISINATIGGETSPVLSSNEYDYRSMPSISFSAVVKAGDVDITDQCEVIWNYSGDFNGFSKNNPFDFSDALPNPNVGTATFKCGVRYKGSSGNYTEKENFTTITIKPISLQKSNLSWENSGFDPSYDHSYYVCDDNECGIPRVVPDNAWTGTYGKITAEYEYYSTENYNEPISNPWKNPGTYFAKAKITKADNYKPGVLEFEDQPTFTVKYYPAPDKPYSIISNKTGEKVDGHDEYKWYLGDVTIKPTGGYTLSNTADGAYSSEGITYTETKDFGQGPGELYFMAEGKYPIYDTETGTKKAYTLGQIIYLDKELPTATLKLKLKQSGADTSSGSYTKGDVTYTVENVSDVGAGIDSDAGVWCYVSSTKTSGSAISTSSWGEPSKGGTISTENYPSGTVYVYVKLKDKAGNINYLEEQYITMDTNAPIFTSKSSGRVIESDDKIYYVGEGQSKVIVVSDNNKEKGDAGLNNPGGVTCEGGGDVGAINDDGTCEVTFQFSKLTDEPTEYKITATDKAGNTATRRIKIAKAVVNVDADASKIVLGSAVKNSGGTDVTGSVYGYGANDADVVKPVSLVLKGESSVTAKIVSAEMTGEGAGNFKIEGDKPNFTVRPKEKLDVLDGEMAYNGTIAVTYDLVAPDSEDFLSEHTVNVSVSFTVVKKELKVKYLGNTEFFHAKADFKLKLKEGYDYDTATKPGIGERFAVNDDEEEIAVMVSGFVYDQASNIESVKGYKDPTMPDIGKRHGLADKATKRVKPNSGAAKNYYFTCEEGTMTCVRRQLPDAREIVGTEGSNGWYTSKVTIQPSSKEGDTYTIMDYTSKVSSADGDNVTYADYAPSKDEDVDKTETGFKAAGYTFYNETTADGVTKYYYIHNEKTDEVSSLMSDVIWIDRTAAHETYTAADKADTKDGTIATKAEGDLPYISVDADKWSEFLHAITFGLYFNDKRTVTVHNVYDPNATEKEGSGIEKVEYLIQDKSATDPAVEGAKQRSGGYGDTETSEGSIESVIGNLDGWSNEGVHWSGSGEVSFNVDVEKTKIDEGYLYVRITNGAGLKTYLTIGRLIIFDSKGPTVTADHEANYDGSLKLSTEKEFADGATFIAEKVHFTISDSNLHAGSAEDPAVRVYKGTDISNASNIVGIIGEDGSSTGEQAVFINEKAEGAEKAETEWDITLYCGNYMNRELKDGKATYTIVAKDDSGFVTIRYFTIVKPIYDISMASQVFTTEVYGYGSATSKTLSSGNGWSRTSKANADANVTDLSLDTRGANYFNVEKTGSSSEWKITPKTNLNAGTYTAVATLTYDDTDGLTKKTNGNILFRVDKRELTATYLGDTIRVGEVPTTDGKLSVTGFITGEGVADSSDRTVQKASGYVSPVIKIPSNLTTTTIVTPSGGSADNYRFNYVGGVLTVVSRKAEKGTHYTVTGTLSDTGWYVSNITLAPKSGYVMTSDSLGKVTMNNILITQDTSDGNSKFYIKDSKTGEIYEQNIFTYKKDTVSPVITGVVDGSNYKANKKEITVTDDNLLRVAVNGTSQVVSGGKSTFNIVAEQKQTLFFIVAEDRAGHMTTSTVTLMQEDGADADDIIDEDDYDDSDDDMIQDDTNGSDDSDLGSFTKKVQLVDGAPSTTFTSTNKELKSNVLSSSERTVMKEGSDVNVRLRVQNIDGSVSQADKELVIAALGDYTVAKYLDITLWKTVGSGAEKQVTSTSDTISVTISIPSSIRSTTKSGKVRQFAIVRVHNGSATVLQDRDSSANTITINTSKFSVYALAYRDVDASRARVASSDSSGGGSSSGGSSSGGGSSGGSSGGSGVRAVETDGIVDGSPQTGDKAPIVPTAVGFGVALIGMITVIIIRRRMDYEWVYVDEDGNIIEEEDIR
ncbi:MAG TPA: hypothetical protein DCP06_03565 [Lachnospiraceae bacterium]|nr:hypothetical protein [Lachnospiraceae bacterium]